MSLQITNVAAADAYVSGFGLDAEVWAKIKADMMDEYVQPHDHP